MHIIFSKIFYVIFLMLQGSTLRRARMPGACRSCSGAYKLYGYVPNWASDFSFWACTYFPSSLHKLYRALTNIGWAQENFCRAGKFSEPLGWQASKTKCFMSSPVRAGNAWVHNQHFCYWCPGAEAPEHQYPQCWLNSYCIGTVSFKDSRFTVHIIWHWNSIPLKITQLFRA